MNGKWIDFLQMPREKPGMKTLVWQVVPKSEDRGPQHPLGLVKWYGGFRKYSFFPAPNTIYEQVCLRDIAEFCEMKTREHNQEKAKWTNGSHPLPHLDSTEGSGDAP